MVLITLATEAVERLEKCHLSCHHNQTFNASQETPRNVEVEQLASSF